MSRSNARIAQDGDRVELTIDGKTWRLPHEAAILLGRNLISEAKRAEEFANANRVIADAALGMRLGLPFGLTNNRAIREAAKTAAQWDTSLRRLIPSPTWRGVEFGTPTVGNEDKR